MASLVTILPKTAAAPTRPTVWTKKAGGRSLIDFLTEKPMNQSSRGHDATSRSKTNAFEVFNQESSVVEKPASKTWKRAPLGKWANASAVVKQEAVFAEKPKPPIKKVAIDNNDYKQQKRENYLRRKFQWEEKQRQERKQKRVRFAEERKVRAVEQLRQQVQAMKLQVSEPQTDEQEDSEEDAYDLSLQCDEEMRSGPTDEELIKEKHLNRIKQVEDELAEARIDLEEAKSQSSGSGNWADQGDVEDEELRVKCLEEKLERLKKKM